MTTTAISHIPSSKRSPWTIHRPLLQNARHSSGTRSITLISGVVWQGERCCCLGMIISYSWEEEELHLLVSAICNSLQTRAQQSCSTCSHTSTPTKRARNAPNAIDPQGHFEQVHGPIFSQFHTRFIRVRFEAHTGIGIDSGDGCLSYPWDIPICRKFHPSPTQYPR